METQNFSIQFNLESMKIKLFKGCQFDPEMYHIEDDDNEDI
jgi:hypothetical protein